MTTLAVFDLDGTLTRHDTFGMFLPWYLARRPARLARCWHLPFEAMLFEAGARDNGWMKARVLKALLAGRTEAQIAPLLDAFVDGVLATGMRSNALAALGEHRRAGDRTMLLSANLDFLVLRFATRLGVADVLSTASERDAGGRFTGRLAGANCYGAEKRRRLEEWLGPSRAGLRVVAYADQQSDLALLRWADAAVLVNPSAPARRAARDMAVDIVAW